MNHPCVVIHPSQKPNGILQEYVREDSGLSRPRELYFRPGKSALGINRLRLVHGARIDIVRKCIDDPAQIAQGNSSAAWHGVIRCDRMSRQPWRKTIGHWAAIGCEKTRGVYRRRVKDIREGDAIDYRLAAMTGIVSQLDPQHGFVAETDAQVIRRASVTDAIGNIQRAVQDYLLAEIALERLGRRVMLVMPPKRVTKEQGNVIHRSGLVLDSQIPNLVANKQIPEIVCPSRIGRPFD